MRLKQVQFKAPAQNLPIEPAEIPLEDYVTLQRVRFKEP